MERNIIFLASAALIAASVCVIFLAGVLTLQGERISGLMGTVDSYSARIEELEARTSISCGNAYFSSSSGRKYVSVSGTADEDGKVFLRVENVGREPVLVVNIREIEVGYSGSKFTADYSQSPTFTDIEGKGTCGGALDSGQFLSCVSDGYEDEVSAARGRGDEAFMISYMKADVSAEPYVLMAGDVCVKV